MILAELDVRHTRRHMPTRRVALDASYLPMTGQGHGAALLEAVVAENIGSLTEEQLELLPKFIHSARRGLMVPRIALRYRLQTDTHGLDRSRHRLLDEGGWLVIELDVHGAAVPQVIGAVMAAASMGETSRTRALRAIEAALGAPGVIPEPFIVRRLFQGVPRDRPPRASEGPIGQPADVDWVGVPSDRRWAMEVLGFSAGTSIGRDDVQRRFRRLLRLAHPDHGAESDGAADRIAELSEARALLLGLVAT